MNPVLDDTLVAILVLVSALVAGYLLSPLRARRWMLSKAAPIIGVRAVSWLAPKHCGCDGCPTTEIHLRLKIRTGQK